METTVTAPATPTETETKTGTLAFPPVGASSEYWILEYYRRQILPLFRHSSFGVIRLVALRNMLEAESLMNKISLYSETASSAIKKEYYEEHAARFAVLQQKLKGLREYFDSGNEDVYALVCRAAELAFVSANLMEIWRDINPLLQG